MTARPSARTMALAVVLAAVGIGVLLVVDPTRSAVTPPCPYRTLLGIACPGCGLTRAAHALLHGDWTRAFALNPWAFVATPAAVAFTSLHALPDATRTRRARSGIAWTMLAVTVAFWIWRNTSAYPFLKV